MPLDRVEVGTGVRDAVGSASQMGGETPATAATVAGQGKAREQEDTHAGRDAQPLRDAIDADPVAFDEAFDAVTSAGALLVDVPPAAARALIGAMIDGVDAARGRLGLPPTFGRRNPRNLLVSAWGRLPAADRAAFVRAAIGSEAGHGG